MAIAQPLIVHVTILLIRALTKNASTIKCLQTVRFNQLGVVYNAVYELCLWLLKRDKLNFMGS